MIVDNTVSLLITLSAHSDAAPAASPQQWTQETKDVPIKLIQYQIMLKNT